METAFWQYKKQADVRSYRTYEEWKPAFNVGPCACHTSSYRTYEEWKHAYSSLSTYAGAGSYRTYEEWKL